MGYFFAAIAAGGALGFDLFWLGFFPVLMGKYGNASGFKAAGILVCLKRVSFAFVCFC